MTSGYSRFKKELDRAKENNCKIILLIEGSLSEIYGGYEHSEFSGPSMVKKLFTLWVKYDLVPVFCNNREEMKDIILETFEAIGRNYKHQADVPTAK